MVIAILKADGKNGAASLALPFLRFWIGYAPSPIVSEYEFCEERRIFPLKSKGKPSAVPAIGKGEVKNIFPYRFQSVTAA
jgi:hypothetical protein